MNQSTLWRVLGLLRPYKAFVGLSALMLFIIALTEPAAPQIFKYLLDEGFGADRQRALWLAPLILIIVFLLRGAASFIMGYLMARVEIDTQKKLRNQIFETLLHLPISLTTGKNGAQALNLILQETTKITSFLNVFISGILRNIITIIILIAYLLYLNWRLSLIVFIVTPSIAWLLKKIGKRLRRFNSELQQVNQDMIATLQETHQGEQVIRLFNGYTHEKKRLEKQHQRYHSAFIRTTIAANLATPVTQFLAILGVIVVIVVSLLQAEQGATTGQFVAFITALLMLLAPLKQLSDSNNLWQRAKIAAEAVFEFIAQPQELNGRLSLPLAKRELRFEGVSFSYTDDLPVLIDINFSVNPGQTVAIVGVSGSGKSTLLNLITRFYSPNKGRILLDDADIAEIQLLDLRQHFSLVSQHVVLFNDTLLANICYGTNQLPAIDDSRLLAAIEQADLYTLVGQLPQGLLTNLGINGMVLSGGQRQRVAIARALYKDAPILLLDEATSALDNQSERAIQSALAHLQQGRATLVIAHRLSTIESADLILVMNAGRIVDRGTHSELIQRSGAYLNLYRSQFSSLTE